MEKVRFKAEMFQVTVILLRFIVRHLGALKINFPWRDSYVSNLHRF